MKIVGRDILSGFIDAHSRQKAVKNAAESWLLEAEKASWKKPPDIKDRYATASILKAGRVVFNIKGNDYRLVVQVNYAAGIVRIRWVGTHAEYNKINVEKM
jgi:mRNA interferase HigB